LNVGDEITVIDSPLGLNALIRVAQVSYPLVNEYQIKATIADFIPYSVQEIQYAATVDNQKTIRRVDQQVSYLAKKNAAINSEFLNLVFDAEGNYYTDKISPETIETIAAEVGQDSQNFQLRNIVIEPNKDG